MAKKTQFTPAADPLENAISASGTAPTKNTRGRKGTTNTTDTKKVNPDDYRFNARFTREQGLYLEEKKWQTRKSITELLQELVIADMKKHPEIIKGIDELNR